jgi:HEAT repeat protein
LKEKRDVKGLIKALGYRRDRTVRKSAATALGEIGDPQAVDSLITALEDEDDYVCRAAAEALGQIGDARAVEPLVAAAVYNWDRGIREAAAKALRQIRDAHAVQLLIAALKDQDWGAREKAGEALDRLGWKPDKSEAGAIYCVMRGQWRKCASIGAPAVKPLIDALQRTSWGMPIDVERAEEMCRVLAQIGAPAVEPLVSAFEKVQGKMRSSPGQLWARAEECKAIVNTLGKIGDARAVEPLIASFGRPWTASCWWEAVEALGAIGAPALPLLTAALGDSDQRVREHAAKAIGLIRDPQVVQPLASVLDDRDVSVRKAAVERLGKVGGAEVVEPLAKALGDHDASVRKAAAEALGSARSAKAVEPLTTALSDDEVSVRKAAVASLGRVRSRRKVEPLVAALKDRDRNVRKLAAETLGKLGDSRAVAGLITSLEDGSVRWSAACALAQLGAPEAVEPLIAYLKADRWDTRKSAAEALVGLYQAGALDEAAKAAILAQRDAITQQHDDRYGCLGEHYDDGGIDVSFPL